VGQLRLFDDAGGHPHRVEGTVCLIRHTVLLIEHAIPQNELLVRWVAILFSAIEIPALAVEPPEMVSDCFPTTFMNAIGTWALN
jgi:hypothetical protein